MYQEKEVTTYRNGAVIPTGDELADPILCQIVPSQRGHTLSHAASARYFPRFPERRRWTGRGHVPDGAVIGAVHDARGVLHAAQNVQGIQIVMGLIMRCS